MKYLRVVLVAGAVTTLTLVACGNREDGVVISKTHVPAGTPNTAGGSPHAEAWFLRCKGTKTGRLKDIKVDVIEFNRTREGEPCDLNRGR